jgi:hypothetical protein
MVVVEATAPSTPLEGKPTGERALLESKLSPAILRAFDCWKKSGRECKQAKDGTVELQLFLTDDSATVIDKLKALGLSVSQNRRKGKVVIGRLPVEKLADLAKLTAVRFVAVVRRT